MIGAEAAEADKDAMKDGFVETSLSVPSVNFYAYVSVCLSNLSLQSSGRNINKINLFT